ncbi:MAG: hypothetical protein HRJ53_14360 [Acidobacteria bacterium Pan2503]|uniref:Uncharacterized protein n=1 Tax=Candidatus Acidiferrum panamense TaxID=2741543 RepID=A0A7V8NRG2_9BACT|nr:hypothetical protein [Candidatus Acidoferrum panamensis]
MGRQRVFDQLTLIRLKQPAFQLRAKERSLLVQLVQSLLLEVVFNRDTSDEESENE